MQIEHDAVKAAARHRLADRVGDVRVGGVLDRPARRRAGGDRQHDLRPFPLGEIEIGAEPGAGAAIGADRRLAIERPRAIAKPRERRRHRREGVGLVLHHRDQQAHAEISFPCIADDSAEFRLRGDRQYRNPIQGRRWPRQHRVSGEWADWMCAVRSLFQEQSEPCSIRFGADRQNCWF